MFLHRNARNICVAICGGFAKNIANFTGHTGMVQSFYDSLDNWLLPGGVLASILCSIRWTEHVTGSRQCRQPRCPEWQWRTTLLVVCFEDLLPHPHHVISLGLSFELGATILVPNLQEKFTDCLSFFVVVHGSRSLVLSR